MKKVYSPDAREQIILLKKVQNSILPFKSEPLMDRTHYCY